MASLADQARVDDLIARTGLNDREIGEVIGVSQPTVWRLKHGKVGNVSKYIIVLEKHLGLQSGDVSDAEMIADLASYAQRIPALRETLLSLHRLMRNPE